MTTNINKLAWFGAALTILAWAFVPRMAMAYPVQFPPIPVVETLPLPPTPLTNPAEVER
ncbi:hypothetical protein [Marivita sp.]|uniref:hypothetical protein n=1 Tax=Marivita sp. TaxID=2003365 RepID=UPI003F6CCB34